MEYIRNRNTYLTRFKKHYKNNREEYREKKELRRAKKYGGYFVRFSSVDIYERDKWICGICGKVVDKKLRYPDPMSKSIDHIKPLSKGGQHTPDNVQLAHLRCNLSKGASFG